METTLENALKRIKALEDAIRKADDCLGQSEGIGLLRYMDEESEEGQLIHEVLADDRFART